MVPRDSAWFSWFDGERLVPLREQALYKEDWLGLRALNESGRLLTEDCPGQHMQFSLDWFNEHIVGPFLS